MKSFRTQPGFRINSLLVRFWFLFNNRVVRKLQFSIEPKVRQKSLKYRNFAAGEAKVPWREIAGLREPTGFSNRSNEARKDGEKNARKTDLC
jgi:hypothetical protein